MKEAIHEFKYTTISSNTNHETNSRATNSKVVIEHFIIVRLIITENFQKKKKSEIKSN